MYVSTSTTKDQQETTTQTFPTSKRIGSTNKGIEATSATILDEEECNENPEQQRWKLIVANSYKGTNLLTNIDVAKIHEFILPLIEMCTLIDQPTSQFEEDIDTHYV